jgi:hypothetical protein
MMMEEEIERTREEIRKVEEACEKVEEACEKVEEVLEKVGKSSDLENDGTGEEEGHMEDVVSATVDTEGKGQDQEEKSWFEDENLLELWNG